MVEQIAHVGDTKLKLRMKIVKRVTPGEKPVARDISDMASGVILLARPDGTITSYTAAFPDGGDGTDGYVEYATASSSILPAGSDGQWRAQPKPAVGRRAAL